MLVEALATDSIRAIVPLGSSTIAAAAYAFGTPVWLVTGIGRRLPSGYIDAMVARIDAMTADRDPVELDVEVLPTSFVTDVVGRHGRVPMGPPAIAPECPMAHEFLRHSAIMSPVTPRLRRGFGTDMCSGIATQTRIADPLARDADPDGLTQPDGNVG